MLHCPRSIARTIVYSGLISAATAGSALAADPTGDWRVEDGVANIRVAQCNGSMWGVIAWEKVPGGRDRNNPDPAKQNRPTLGMATLVNMKKKPGVDAWEGQVYNAQDGQTYAATIKPIGADQLEIQGCVLGFLCGGQTWTRVAPPIPSSPVNSAAKNAPKGTPAPQPKAAAAAAPAPAPAAPKTTGSAAPAQKQAAAGQPADIGDICLLPDIARLAH
jgi:uncharacterized protein (DUF2147 family)